MVKTFLCHPYTEPKSFVDQFDAVCFCCTSDDCIFISAASEAVHIHNLKHNGCPKLSKFPTVAVPVKMLHCNKQGFLVSMECPLNEFKKYAKPHELDCQVRIYVNFSKQNLSKPLRVANGYTQNSSVSYVNYINKFMAIDISIRHAIVDFSLCELKCNLALTSRKKIYIYGYKELRSEDETFQHCFVDFFRLIEIAPSFVIRNVSICGCWLAFSSKKEIQVLQIFVREPDDEQICHDAEDVSEALSEFSIVDGLASSKPLESKKEVHQKHSVSDENFIVWNFNELESASSSSQNDHASHVIFDSIKKEAIHIDTSPCSVEIYGPIEHLIGHPIRCVFNQSYSKNNTASYVTMLYKQFDVDDLSISGKVNSIHSLAFLPIFLEDGSKKDESEYISWPWNIFQLQDNPTLLNVALFFSTGRQGFLYNIYNEIEKLVTYDYTSDCFGANHSQSFLYTYTMYGLEVYTTRVFATSSNKWKQSTKGKMEPKCLIADRIPAVQQYHKKNQSSMELFTELNYFGSYVTISKDDVGATNGNISQLSSSIVYSPDILSHPLPSLDVEVCLIGMYGLNNICSLDCSTSFITLFIKTGKREKQGSSYTNQWRIYVLEKTQTEDFYSELLKLVEGNEYSNPGVFYQVLCEAFFILRSDSLLGTIDSDRKSLLESSAVMLADFLARNDSCDEVALREFYELGTLSFKNVIERFINSDLPKEKKFIFSKNMVQYILSHLYLPFNDSTLALSQGECNFIVKVLFKNEPSMLADALLQSKYLVIEDELALKFLTKMKSKQEAKHSKVLAKDLFCLAYINMKLGCPAQCEELLKTIPQVELLSVCVKNVNTILTSNLLTPLGMLIKKHFHSLFRSILIKLFDQNELSLTDMLEFYKKPDHDDGGSFSYKLCEVLEALLSDSKKKKHYPKLSEVIMKQYIHRLTSGSTLDTWKSKHDHLPKVSGHFGERYEWLNNIHPFNGGFSNPQDCVFQKINPRSQGNLKSSSSSNQIVASSFPNTRSLEYTQASPHAGSSPIRKTFDEKISKRTYCTCCCCSEVLLKFQSLLSSKCNRKELSSFVVDQLSSASFVGKDSLLLLCWPKAGVPKEAVEVIIDKYPSVAVQYAKDMFDWKAQWQLLLQHTLSILKSNNSDAWNQNYLNCLKGVLSRLSRAYSPDEFLSFLPSDGNIHFFLPYLRECWEHNASMKVKQQFIGDYSNNEQVNE